MNKKKALIKCWSLGPVVGVMHCGYWCSVVFFCLGCLFGLMRVGFSLFAVVVIMFGCDVVI